MKKTIDYRAKKAELDVILAWFESENISIDEALAKYEQANKLIVELEAYLNDTKIKIDHLAKRTPHKEAL
jgi:exodeoxyribonuclease VII small subunit